MKSSETLMAEVIVDALPSAQPLDAEASPPGLLLPLLPFLAGVFFTACVFIMVSLYCDQRQRKQYVPHDWNRNISTLTTPWYHFHGKLGSLNTQVPGEKSCLLTPMNFSTINTHSSKNKADSKYQKVKRQFPYFVTIPEEEEDQESRFQNQHSYKSCFTQV